jgi:hypothetical protein
VPLFSCRTKSEGLGQGITSHSIGFLLFQLQMGYLPCLIPPLAPDNIAATMYEEESTAAIALLEPINLDIGKAQDNLLAAKVMLSTEH